MKPIEASFRQDCLKHVEDPTPWLVFSDWLEEDGQLALAAAYQKRRFRNSLGMELVLVPAGSFWMGGGDGKPGDKQVEIPADFLMGTTPVTQGQWQAVMAKNPSSFSRAGRERVQDVADADLLRFPVENVSWNMVKGFLKKLNAREKGSGWTYRLPTEAQWEYSCRGGASSQEECSFHFYLDQPSNDLSSTQANFNGNSPAGSAGQVPYLGRPTRVGSYQPNRLGLYDMHGNVWEWTSSQQGPHRVIRGGSWLDQGVLCTAALRRWHELGISFTDLGFRLLAVPSV